LKNQNSRQPVNRQVSSVTPATPPQTVAAPAPLQITVSTPQDNNARWTAKDILQAIGLVFTALGLFYTGWNLRYVQQNLQISQKNLQARIALDALIMLEGRNGETWRNWLELEDLVSQAGGPHRISVFDPYGRVPEKLLLLARAFDTAGLLVKFGVLPVDLLFNFYSRPIVTTWVCMEPVVRARRMNEIIEQPGHMRMFEILAVGAVLERRSTRPNEKVTFEPNEAQRTAWENLDRNAWKMKPADWHRMFETAEAPLRTTRSRAAVEEGSE
jgi:hypothetical protein